MGGGICPKFELILVFMHVLITCNYEDDSIKTEGARAVTTFSHYKSTGFFSSRSNAANSAALSLIWPNFELVRDFIVVLVTCKNEDDSIKNEGARVFTTLYINFSDAQGQITPESVVGIWPNFDFTQAFMHSIVTCKNEDDSIKNEGARVVTTFFPL